VPPVISHADEIRDRLAGVRDDIAEAARAAGRKPQDVRLVAVTKTFAAPQIEPALHASQRVFGENRVQEAAAKWPALREKFADIDLHLIGALQSNKARDAVRLFDAIHSIDRPKIAKAVAEEQVRQGRRLKLFIQVNTGAEPQKAGAALDEAERLAAYCRDELDLAISGLMCIPPAEAEPEPHFRMLANLGRRLGLHELSMGMSADYQAAIRCGATYVRVGSAIFGAR
jgi:pyridoxal phosphate enzyme (YggS family)